MEITARNTNDLQGQVYRRISALGVKRDSRNGPVLTIEEPVSIQLTHPWERVNFCPLRDANPFFHLWESLAMLAGVNSVHLMGFFAKNMLSYTDDGLRYNAFYGERARVKWGDQLRHVVDELEKNPASRQCVVNLWDPADWLRSTKDKACNLSLLFSVDSNEQLRMTTYNRSNDAIFGGVTGANVVHLSFFQEYAANALHRTMGPWWHVSNNLHVYTENPKWETLRANAEMFVESVPGEYPASRDLMRNGREVFDKELHALVELAAGISRCPGAIIGFDDAIQPDECTEPFLRCVAVPMFNAWVCHKMGRTQEAVLVCNGIIAEDWRIACQDWLNRRIKTS